MLPTGRSTSTVEKGGVAGAEFSADMTFSHWFCSLINVCSSLQSLLCLFERNIAMQPKIHGNLGDLYEQNDVSVSKVQFRFKVFIPRIPSVFRYRGKSLALDLVVKMGKNVQEMVASYIQKYFFLFNRGTPVLAPNMCPQKKKNINHNDKHP